MALDAVEALERARRRHVQRAVAHRDAVRLIEATRDHHHAVGLVVAVAVDHRVHLAGRPRSDEHGALRAERHHPRVADVLGIGLEREAPRNDQGTKRPWWCPPLTQDVDVESGGHHPLTRLLRDQARGAR